MYVRSTAPCRESRRALPTLPDALRGAVLATFTENPVTVSGGERGGTATKLTNKLFLEHDGTGGGAPSARMLSAAHVRPLGLRARLHAHEAELSDARVAVQHVSETAAFEAAQAAATQQELRMALDSNRLEVEAKLSAQRAEAEAMLVRRRGEARRPAE
jgi:hypothetical protein